MKNIYEVPWTVGQQWVTPDEWDHTFVSPSMHRHLGTSTQEVKHVLLVAGVPESGDAEVLANLTHLRTAPDVSLAGGPLVADYICQLHNAELARKHAAQSE